MSFNISCAEKCPLAHDFSLRDQSGDQIDLKQILKNNHKKIIILSIFQTTCAPCMEEILFLNSIKDKYSFELYIIDSKEDRNTTFLFLKKHNYDWKNILNDPNGKLDSLFDITAIPKMIILNENGNILISKDGKEIYDLRKTGKLETLIEKYATKPNCENN